MIGTIRRVDGMVFINAFAVILVTDVFVETHELEIMYAKLYYEEVFQLYIIVMSIVGF